MPDRLSFLKLTGLTAALTLVPMLTSAGEIVVAVEGVRPGVGEVGCALFSSAAGFPLQTEMARSQWLPATTVPISCRFEAVPAGQYAVAVGHDLNKNRKTDTNFLGIPTEPWGVSGNVRPRLRAPRFDEAAFTVGENAAVELSVRVLP